MTWLLQQASTQPDEVALRVDTVSHTWREVATRAEALAAGLQAQADDAPVALLAGNGLDFVAVVWASLWTGTSLVLLNTRLSDADLSWQIQNSGVSVLIVDRSFAERSLELNDVRRIGLESLARKPSSLVPVAMCPSTTMLYTSGSTSTPKLVSLSWRNHEASALASAKNLGVERDDWLCCLPLYHVGGLSIVVRGAIYGTCVTLLESFDAAQVMERLQTGCTLVSLVPTMLIRLARQAGSVEQLATALRDTSLRAILLGGGPADPAFVGECLRAGLPVVQTYGMTEACSQLVTMPPSRALEKLGSSGLPLEGVELSIRSEHGESTGGLGVVWVRGPMVIAGYVGQTSDDDERFVDGWFRTGDIGELDEDGFLWVHGRHDHVIVTGGENVSPELVERVINRHPDVDEVLICGEDDVEWGRRVVAVVVSRATEEELDAYCREHLAGHQQPKSWRFVGQLPRTSTGKLIRRALD